MDTISAYFWAESFWLPPNTKWKDFEKYTDIELPKAWHILLTIPIGVCIFVARLVFERFIATPIGRIYKLKERPPPTPQHIQVLEDAFRKKKALPKENQLIELSKRTDLTTRQIERWWRRKRVSLNPSLMQKFRETSWRFTFYFSAFWYGIWILSGRDYFYDSRKCWIGFPYQHVDNYVWWYYELEISFYLSLVMSSFMDVKRKDFIEMVSHHLATIALLVLSFVSNFVRIGSMILVVHDAVDWWMEGAKLAKYTGYSKLTDALFIIFTIVWAITRLFLFPYFILYSVYFESVEITGGHFPMHKIFSVLLTFLQILHIYWFYLICKMIYKYIITGSVEKDERSESEVESSDSEKKNNNSFSNGKKT